MIALMLLIHGSVSAQLAVTNALTPQQLVDEVLLGGGVTAFNVTYNGQASPPANQPGRGSFTATNSNLGLEAGVILSTGLATEAANNETFFASDANGTGSDPDLVALSGQNINDRSVLEFDFIPTGDTLRFRYVFASEEYPDYVCSNFNDAFGFFLSGPGIAGPFQGGAANIALIPGTTTPVTINSVNSGVPGGFQGAAACVTAAGPNWQQNSQFFVNNDGGATVAYGGFTVVLTAFALVECGETYHIKLAIGDGTDSSFDSAVFLEAGSFTSTGQVQPTLVNGFGNSGDIMLEGCGPYEFTFVRQGDLTEEVSVALGVSGTAQPGVDYSPAFPDSLFYGPGEESLTFQLDVPLQGAGPRTLIITVQQLTGCTSGQEIEFVFTIDNAPPLEVTTTDVDITCGQSATLNAQVSGGIGLYTYLWSTGETTPTITVSPTATTIYSVTVDDICGVVPVTGEVTVNLPDYPPIELEVSPPTEVECLGTGPIEVISAVGGDGTFTYEWSLDGQVLGTDPVLEVPASDPIWYLVTVTDGCGATAQDSVLVSTAPLPEIEITTVDDITVICPGDSAVVAVVDITGGNGVYTLEWTDPFGNVISADPDVQVWVPADQTFTITVNDQCGYSGTAEVNTLLPVYAPFQLEVPPDFILCAGEDADLQALVTGGSGYYFVEWNEQGATDPVLTISPPFETLYTVRVEDQCGESLTDSVRVGVEYVFTDIVVTNRGLDDWYLQAATEPYAETWLWDMGDGTRYRGDEVVHSYLDLEEHLVTLRITTPNGCVGEDTVLLRSPGQLYFPNAFTPDGDGINDLFGPLGTYIEEFEMTIFDRWGNEVFTTKDMSIMWDGRVRGAERPVNGVYVYKYQASGHLFPAVEGYGHVTLIAGSQGQ